MKVTKSATVRSILATQPHLSNGEIAKLAQCDISLVYQLRKVKHVSRGKVGRPRKVVEPKQISVLEASYALMQVVNGVKDLSISFDTTRDKLDVLWHEELYQIDISELPQTIDCIKFLNSKQPNYNTMELYYDGI
jgi:hypothetical protein